MSLMTCKIIQLEDIKTSKFLQRKNIRCTKLDSNNALFKITLQKNSGNVIAIDLSGTLTWRALNGTINIKNSLYSKDILMLKKNQFTVSNGNESDQNLLNYITKSLDIPREDIKNVNTKSQVLLSKSETVLKSAIRENNSVLTEVSKSHSNSTFGPISKPFRMPFDSKQSVAPLDTYTNKMPSNPNLPSSFKQIYTKSNDLENKFSSVMPHSSNKRSFSDIIDDVREEFKKHPKIDFQPNMASEVEETLDGDFLNVLPTPIEDLEFPDSSQVGQVNSLGSEIEFDKISEEEILDAELSTMNNKSDVILVEKSDSNIAKISKVDSFIKMSSRNDNKKIELSSDVVLIANSVYNNSFHDA
eukprot:NODE_431_length_8736_cov_0.126780.p2 type:complete len:358 gc:universal NODE_431_length_8736_cov_0.126780:2372-3445(+)